MKRRKKMERRREERGEARGKEKRQGSERKLGGEKSGHEEKRLEKLPHPENGKKISKREKPWRIVDKTKQCSQVVRRK